MCLFPSQVRIFSYAVGPTANPVAAARWIACSNRGLSTRGPGPRFPCVDCLFSLTAAAFLFLVGHSASWYSGDGTLITNCILLTLYVYLCCPFVFVRRFSRMCDICMVSQSFQSVPL